MFSGSNLDSSALAVSEKLVKQQLPINSLKAYQASQITQMKVNEREELKNA